MFRIAPAFVVLSVIALAQEEPGYVGFGVREGAPPTIRAGRTVPYEAMPPRRKPSPRGCP